MFRIRDDYRTSLVRNFDVNEEIQKKMSKLLKKFIVERRPDFDGISLIERRVEYEVELLSYLIHTAKLRSFCSVYIDSSVCEVFSIAGELNDFHYIVQHLSSLAGKRKIIINCIRDNCIINLFKSHGFSELNVENKTFTKMKK